MIYYYRHIDIRLYLRYKYLNHFIIYGIFAYVFPGGCFDLFGGFLLICYHNGLQAKHKLT